MKTSKFGLTNKVLIAGPCSAESLEQLNKTAIALKKHQPDYFRAGVWKPRTRPESFEGYGEKALQWLQYIKQTHNLKIITEVATPHHVEQALQHNIDAIWIGARTTTNPFSIQDIAQTLKGEHLPIFVKNPLNPDLKLWIGAIERLLNSGLTNIYAVHRGFSLADNGDYRQSPLWQIPIELKRTFPEIKILCDPSHISGKRELVSTISQTAMNIGLDGLMIEVHHNPQQAQTDALQQLTPQDLDQLIENLNITNTNEDHLPQTIDHLRSQIDDIDTQLINLLSQRMKISTQIAKVKKQTNLSVLQINRWKTLLNNRLQYSQSQGLSEKFTKEIFETIHQESVKIQDQVIKEE